MYKHLSPTTSSFPFQADNNKEKKNFDHNINLLQGYIKLNAKLVEAWHSFYNPFNGYLDDHGRFSINM